MISSCTDLPILALIPRLERVAQILSALCNIKVGSLAGVDMATIQDSIVLFGDSITEGGYENNGFVAKLAHAYGRKLDVINRGFSGYNTDWAKIIFGKVFPNQDQQVHLPTVRLLTIWFGANDAALEGGKQHVPLDRFAANLSSLVASVRSPDSPHYSPKTGIILVTPPPFNAHQWAIRQASASPPGRMDREFGRTKTYADAVKQVGAEEGLPVLDTWRLIWEAAGATDESAISAFSYDGLHLNEKGYEIVYDGLIQTIKDAYPEIHPDRLAMSFPRWDTVDPRNPEASLQQAMAAVESR